MSKVFMPIVFMKAAIIVWVGGGDNLRRKSCRKRELKNETHQPWVSCEMNRRGMCPPGVRTRA